MICIHARPALHPLIPVTNRAVGGKRNQTGICRIKECREKVGSITVTVEIKGWGLIRACGFRLVHSPHRLFKGVGQKTPHQLTQHLDGFEIHDEQDIAINIVLAQHELYMQNH